MESKHIVACKHPLYYHAMIRLSLRMHVENTFDFHVNSITARECVSVFLNVSELACSVTPWRTITELLSLLPAASFHYYGDSNVPARHASGAAERLIQEDNCYYGFQRSSLTTTL